MAQQPQTMVREQPILAQNKEVMPMLNKQQVAVKKAPTEERKVVSYEEDRSDVEDAPTSIVTFQQAHHPLTRADVAVSAANTQPLTAQAGLRVANKFVYCICFLSKFVLWIYGWCKW